MMKLFTCILGLIILLLLVISLNYYVDLPLVPTPQSSTEELQNYWRAQIKKDGGSHAYRFFKESYTNESVPDKHKVAHIFGGALYETEGVDGLQVCDSSNSYGCYHEFIGQALYTEGLHILPGINEFCLSKGGCQHGVGHGLLAYFGYNSDGLEDALMACNSLGSVDPLDGCFGGIYMEYNDRTMLEVDGVSARPFDSDNYENICTNAPLFAKDACYFWLPSWIMDSVSGSFSSRFAQTTSLCERMEEGFLMCVNGLSGEIVSFTHDVHTFVRACEDQSSNKSDNYLVQCLSSGLRNFKTITPDLEMLLPICDILTTAAAVSFCKNEVTGRVKDTRTSLYVLSDW